MCYAGVEDERHVLVDCVAYERERESLVSDIGEAGKSLVGIVRNGEIVDCDEMLRRCLFGDCKDEMIRFLAVIMRKRSEVLQLGN